MDTQIANNFTVKDWRELESEIVADFNNEQLWKQALDIFESRINERYIIPAKTIQDNLSVSGEGFSITIILCSLVEALQSFNQGICYKNEKPRTNTEYGNGKSKKLFINFLTKNKPFSVFFDHDLADDFYKNVRCSLVHEAMTRNGWKIRINTNMLVVTEGEIKIFNRFYFLELMIEYIKEYREQTIISKVQKNAFLCKMKCICNNS